MKKMVFAAVGILFILNSCTKKDAACDRVDLTIVAPNTEIAALGDSLAAHGITNTTLHPSGFYYTIVNPGNGNFVSNLCATITTTYRGGFFNGIGFDSTKTGDQAAFTLGQVIPGWQKGIPLVKAGGTINLYIPPSLGYGANDVKNPITGAVIIPGGSYLVFNVNVIGIQAY